MIPCLIFNLQPDKATCQHGRQFERLIDRKPARAVACSGKHLLEWSTSFQNPFSFSVNQLHGNHLGIYATKVADIRDTLAHNSAMQEMMPWPPTHVARLNNDHEENHGD